jgi:hypothetical protein
MKTNFWKNQFWIVTGIETAVLGFIFLQGNRLDNHIFPPFNQADTHSFSWLMVLWGMITIIIFLLRKKMIKLKVIAISGLGIIWCYMGINFLLTALDPDYPITTHPLILAVISLALVARIMINAFLESPEKLKGDD